MPGIWAAKYTKHFNRQISKANASFAPLPSLYYPQIRHSHVPIHQQTLKAPRAIGPHRVEYARAKRRNMRLHSLVGLILRVSIPLCRIHTTAAADLPVPGSLSGSSALGYSWNVKAQNESLCDAGGKQWTGTVKVTPERTLFFCECDG
jgi:hypothetical protein